MPTPNRPSIMFRKFEEAAQDPSWLYEPPPPWRKSWYFFYGELMDPPTLQSIINPVQSQSAPLPQLYPASTQGYTIKLLGDYLAAIVNMGSDWHIPTRGAAYQVQSEDEENRLIEYEMSMNFSGRGSALTLDDGNVIANGRLFVWAGDRSLLRDRISTLGSGWAARRDN